MNIAYDVGRIMTDKRSKALILVGLILLNAGVAFAQKTAVQKALGCLACRIMQIVIFIIGAVATLVIIFAGLKWIGSGEDPEARNQAKQLIIHAIVGVVIVILAAFIVSWLVTVTIPGIEIADPAIALTSCDTADYCGA